MLQQQRIASIRFIVTCLDRYWTRSRDTRTVYVPNSNEVWSRDITYIRMNGDFMYLSAIIYWHSKAVLSYKLSNSMDAMCN